MIQKNELRKDALEKRKNADKELLRALSDKICEKITGSSYFIDAKTVYGYIPVRGEADILPVLRKALESGKSVAVPRCIDRQVMFFYEIKSLKELKKGAFGIPEPTGDTPFFDTKDAIMLVPGAAFDRQSGQRLGYGAGYYDRYLKEHGIPLKIGVAYEFSLYDMPVYDENDINMNMIATEKDIYACVKDDYV